MTMPEQSDEQMEHSFLKRDLEQLQKRASKAKFLEAQKEFSEQVYPFLETMLDHFGDRMVRLESAVDALIDETDSIIQGDLAEQLLATVELGTDLAEAVMKLQAGQTLDDTTLQRLVGQAGAYLTAAELATEAIESHQVSPDGEPEETDPEGDEDEIDDEDEADAEVEEVDDEESPTPPPEKGA